MNILEIHTDYAWWFQVATEEEYLKVREEALRKLERANRWHEGCYYFLNGDAETFNLKDGTFDAIRIIPRAGGGKSKGLERRARRWLKKEGLLTFGAIKGLTSTGCTLMAAGAKVLTGPFAKCEMTADAVVHSVLPVIGSSGMI
jgi:ubiquinone/menaquinone biosynthesis C-methylase UbiE